MMIIQTVNDLLIYLTTKTQPNAYETAKRCRLALILVFIYPSHSFFKIIIIKNEIIFPQQEIWQADNGST